MLTEIKGFLMWLFAAKRYVVMDVQEGYFSSPGWEWDLEGATQFTRGEAMDIQVTLYGTTPSRDTVIVRV